MSKLEKFKSLFWDAFHRPKLESEKYFKVWEGLEPVNDLLAGPLYAIYSNSNCNYIFEDKNRFPGMNTPEDFFDYCSKHIKNYHQTVSTIESSNEIEKQDKNILLYQIDIKSTLAKLAYDMIKENY